MGFYKLSKHYIIDSNVILYKMATNVCIIFEHTYVIFIVQISCLFKKYILKYCP